MIRTALVVCATATCLQSLEAQAPNSPAPRSFETVSIKPSRKDATVGDTKTSPGRLTLANATTLSLLRRAFGVQDVQIVAGPRWLGTDRYDVIGVTGTSGQLTDTQRQPFLQVMLADRFHLKFHRERRDMPTYSLVPAKTGHKMLPSSAQGFYSMKVNSDSGRTILQSTKGTVPRLVEILSREVGRIVVDNTGLAGQYDFTLQWVPNQDTETAGPSLFTAIREQLGLALLPKKLATDVIVIDHIERPTEN